MSFYDSRKPMVREFWSYDITRLRAIAQDKIYTPAVKRLATGIANQKEGLRKAPSIKENRAKALNYIIFALKGMEGTLGSMGYRAQPGNTDLTSYEYHTLQASIQKAREAVFSVLRYAEQLSAEKSKKKKVNKENDDAFHSDL